MKVNKTFVLAFDGLDYSLVSRLRLENLLQEENGLVRVPLLRELCVPSTPVVFRSFITGRNAELLDVAYRWKTKTASPVDGIVNMLNLGIVQRCKRVDTLVKRLRFDRLMRKLGFERDDFRNQLREEEIETIFDIIEPSIALSIPAYDESRFGYAETINYADALGVDSKTKEVIPKLDEMFKLEREEMWEELEKEWRLFMIHFDVPDHHAHLWYRKDDMPKLIRFYRTLDDFAALVRSKLEQNVWLLIISDHGTLYGGHTLYGFYSSNKKLSLLLPHITDFKGLITGSLLTRDENSREKVKRRLSRLGYFS